MDISYEHDFTSFSVLTVLLVIVDLPGETRSCEHASTTTAIGRGLLVRRIPQGATQGVIETRENRTGRRDQRLSRCRQTCRHDWRSHSLRGLDQSVNRDREMQRSRLVATIESLCDDATGRTGGRETTSPVAASAESDAVSCSDDD